MYPCRLTEERTYTYVWKSQRSPPTSSDDGHGPSGFGFHSNGPSNCLVFCVFNCLSFDEMNFYYITRALTMLLTELLQIKSISSVQCLLYGVFSSEVQVPAIEYVTYFIRDLKTNGFLFFIKVSMYHSFEIWWFIKVYMALISSRAPNLLVLDGVIQFHNKTKRSC